jgi:hypothetical protein
VTAAVVTQRRRDGRSETPPTRYVGERTAIASLRRVAFGEHFLEKLMTCSLRHCACIDPKTPRRVQGLCSMAQAEPLETTGS